MNAPTRKRPYKPEPSATNAPRQARLRERRKAQGWRRVSVWLSPEQVATLETLGGDAWLGRTVKTLLGRAVAEPRRGKQKALFDAPGPVSDSDNAALVEADSLHKAGLSWEAIARRWNAEGRRTERGAEFRGANISREVRKGKGETGE